MMKQTHCTVLRWFYSLAVFSFVAPEWGYAQLIENANIRSWTQSFSGWNMEADQTTWVDLNLPSEIKREKILGLTVLIYSDAGTPEVFNISRQSGRSYWGPNTQNGTGRSGGWAALHYLDNGTWSMSLDRGPCVRRQGQPCETGTKVQSFFAATSSSNGSETFLSNTERMFKSTTKVRGSIKIDYACTTCGNTYPNKLWIKLGGWDMKNGRSKGYSKDNLTVDPNKVVGMSAAIHSDPDAAGKVQVDNLEHVGALNGTGSPRINRMVKRSRGGILWYGLGCLGGGLATHDGCLSPTNLGYTTHALRVWQGPVGTPHTTTGLSDYSGTFPYENGTRMTQITYSNPSINRGWVKLEYTGSKVTMAVPYVFRQRAYPLNAWNMGSALYYSMPFSNLKLAVNRIAGITSTILSDYAPTYGAVATNFHRPASASGADAHGEIDLKVGGFTLIDEAEGAGSIILNQGVRWSDTYYAQPAGYTPYQYTSNVNRGHVLVDYLAGSCDQGGSGLLIRAIPAPTSETCSGTGNLVLQASGSVNGINGTKDDFVYAYKLTGGSYHKSIAKLVSQDNSNPQALSGIMIRSSLNDNAKFVAILVKPGGGGYVRYRNQDGGSAGQTNFACNTTPWIRIDFGAPTFDIYYSNSSSMPTTSQWSRITTVPINTFPTSPNSYFVGAASTNSNSINLQKSTFNLSGTL